MSTTEKATTSITTTTSDTSNSSLEIALRIVDGLFLDGCNSILNQIEACFNDSGIKSSCEAARQAQKCYEKVISVDGSRCTSGQGTDTQASELRQEITRLCSGAFIIRSLSRTIAT